MQDVFMKKREPKQGSLKAPRIISVSEFDAMFDAGEDILEYLDLKSAKFFGPGEPADFPFSAPPDLTYHPKSPL